MAKKILIVEDDHNISELLQLYLNNEGYQTVIANDGGEGIDQFRKFQPDLVLLDIMLPAAAARAASALSLILGVYSMTCLLSLIRILIACIS